MGLNIKPQRRVDATLDISASFSKPVEKLGIDVEGNLDQRMVRGVLAKKASSNGGTSEVSISASVSAETLFQSVSEVVLKLLSLMA